jgi:hypothetical protein
LVIATPNARVFDDESAELLRRKEQSFFDRVAREGGFVFVSIPATRWFSRQPVAVIGPSRSITRYDVRSPIALEDSSRGDLARETKQVLAYGAITRALAASDSDARAERLALALEHSVNALVESLGYSWVGVDPITLEPTFETRDKRVLSFDQVPTRVRHLVAFATLPVRALWAAYPNRDPLEAEGIVTIDEVDVNQDAVVLSQLVERLRAALPAVQWILTTSSSVLASSCDIDQVIVLRRSPDRDASVELFTGESARTH